jgi:hypothetical protein
VSISNDLQRNWIIAGVATVCLIAGVALSHRVEPGIRVEKVTLAQNTPALRFMPTGAGPHPVALLVHGYAASKETSFDMGRRSQPLDLFPIALTNRRTERRRGN